MGHGLSDGQWVLSDKHAVGSARVIQTQSVIKVPPPKMAPMPSESSEAIVLLCKANFLLNFFVFIFFLLYLFFVMSKVFKGKTFKDILNFH